MNSTQVNGVAQTNLAFQGLHPSNHPFDGFECLLSIQRTSFGSIQEIIGRILERSKLLFDIPLRGAEYLTVIFIGNLCKSLRVV